MLPAEHPISGMSVSMSSQQQSLSSPPSQLVVEVVAGSGEHPVDFQEGSLESCHFHQP
jgi:hypothetical protein